MLISAHRVLIGFRAALAGALGGRPMGELGGDDWCEVAEFEIGGPLKGGEAAEGAVGAGSRHAGSGEVFRVAAELDETGMGGLGLSKFGENGGAFFFGPEGESEMELMFHLRGDRSGFGEAVTDGDVPEEFVAFAGDAFLEFGKVLFLQGRLVAESRVEHVVEMKEFLAKKEREASWVDEVAGEQSDDAL